MRKPNRERRGAALIIALVCIVILGFLLVSVLRFALVRRKASTLQMNRAQATCLAESGLRRAAARLAVDPDYPGETWKITPESLHGEDGASVTIEVETPDEENENTRFVKATADYPNDSPKRARVTKELTIKLNPES